jgi:hypothetical protein
MVASRTGPSGIETFIALETVPISDASWGRLRDQQPKMI